MPYFQAFLRRQAKASTNQRMPYHPPPSIVQLLHTYPLQFAQFEVHNIESLFLTFSFSTAHSSEVVQCNDEQRISLRQIKISWTFTTTDHNDGDDDDDYNEEMRDARVYSVVKVHACRNGLRNSRPKGLWTL